MSGTEGTRQFIRKAIRLGSRVVFSLSEHPTWHCTKHVCEAIEQIADFEPLLSCFSPHSPMATRQLRSLAADFFFGDFMP
jgi:hypothetical protein